MKKKVDSKKKVKKLVLKVRKPSNKNKDAKVKKLIKLAKKKPLKVPQKKKFFLFNILKFK